MLRVVERCSSPDGGVPRSPSQHRGTRRYPSDSSAPPCLVRRSRNFCGITSSHVSGDVYGWSNATTIEVGERQITSRQGEARHTIRWTRRLRTKKASAMQEGFALYLPRNEPEGIISMSPAEGRALRSTSRTVSAD